MKPSRQKRFKRDGKIFRQQETYKDPSHENITQTGTVTDSVKDSSLENITQTGDIVDKVRHGIPQVLTLSNRFNSCFINTSLQLLFAIEEFREYILKFSGSRFDQPVTSELSSLFRPQPGRLTSACGLRYWVAQSMGDQRFNRGTEEDSTEFLLTLFMVLEREWENSEEGIALLNKFRGKEKIQRKFVNRYLNSSSKPVVHD